MDIKTISDRIYSNVEDRGKMEKMNAVYYEMADFIKEQSPTAYNRFYEMAEGIAYDLTKDEAQAIVRNMQPYGEKWDWTTIHDFIMSKGETDCINYYLTMNMMYNDYYRTASAYGMDNADFYFSLAKDFIDDVDGGTYKVAKYFSA